MLTGFDLLTNVTAEFTGNCKSQAQWKIKDQVAGKNVIDLNIDPVEKVKSIFITMKFLKDVHGNHDHHLYDMIVYGCHLPVKTYEIDAYDFE